MLWLKRGTLLAGLAFCLPAAAYDIAAAENAAATNESCMEVAASGFYWEIGDVNGAITSGSEGSNPPAADQLLYVDSASKWVFGAYVLQRRGGLSGLQPGTSGGYANSDVAYLQLGDGYADVAPGCTASDTVAQCFARGSNGTQTAGNIGKFYYGGGDFLAMANNSLGLSDMNASELAAEIERYIPGISITMFSPQPAAGMELTPGDYAKFLRQVLSGALVMSDALPAHNWCTNPNSSGGKLKKGAKYCATAAYAPPMPDKIAFEYGLAHWIEHDPDSANDGGVPGDGAFNSLGADGFYPWIDASKTYYGILAPTTAEIEVKTRTKDYQKTLLCGQAIRQAFVGP